MTEDKKYREEGVCAATVVVELTDNYHDNDDRDHNDDNNDDDEGDTRLNDDRKTKGVGG